MILRLIDAPCAAGATRIQRPACPFCGRVVTLSKRIDGQRACRTCAARARAVPCARCGRVSEPASRDPGGQPVCAYCLSSAPVNLEDCVRCGRRRQVDTRIPEQLAGKTADALGAVVFGESRRAFYRAATTQRSSRRDAGPEFPGRNLMSAATPGLSVVPGEPIGKQRDQAARAGT